MKPQTAGNRPYQHLYGRRAWPRLRARQLAQEPLCRMCQDSGITEPATIADHIIPHKGDWFLFFDAGNLQSLCTAHHNAAKQQDEKLGFSGHVGADGWPIDRQHPVNQGEHHA